MQSSLQHSSKAIYFILAFLLFTGLASSQSKKFTGTEILKEGNAVASRTIPVINNSEPDNLYDLLNQNTRGLTERYVMGGTIIWSAFDGAAISTTVKLDAAGTTPLSSWTLNDQRVSLYGTVNNIALWNYTTPGLGNSVDVSADGSVIAVVQDDKFVLLDKSDGSVVYELEIPDSLAGNNVSISGDGQIAVFTTGPREGYTTARAYAVALSGITSEIMWKFDVPSSQIINWTGATISETADRVVLMGRYHFFVLELSTGSVIWDHFMDNSESTAGMSADGKVIATANLSGFVQTWLWNSSNQEYNLLWQYRFPSGNFTNWATSVNISADGNTIVAGSLIFLSAGYDGSIAAFDTYGNGTPKWTYTGAEDMVADIALSADGRVAAAVTWGDLNHVKPDLYVFDVATGELSFSVVTPGSFETVDISSDGSRVIAGGKAVHNRQFGMGGRVYYAEVDLGGGNISGTVNLAGTSDNSGVVVKAVGTVRSAVTDASGNYVIKNVPAGTYTVTATKPGYNFGSAANVVVTNGNTTTGVNFNLAAFGGTAPVLSASTNLVGRIELQWTSTGANKLAADDSYLPDELTFADSIGIYRSLVSGGPYQKLTAVPATQNSYSDTAVLPLRTYYYVVSKLTDAGQGSYSNEVIGKVSDSLLTFKMNVPHTENLPSIDGILSAGEWDDALKVDISDIFGYSGGLPQQQGSVYMYLKFSLEDSTLFIAGEDFLNPTLNDNEGFGLYFDDNNNNMFEADTAFYKEGNFWAYWHPTGSLVRFRQLLTGGGVGTVDTLRSVPAEFSDAAGHVTGEVAIPLGFAEGFKLQLFGPDSTVGLGAFMIARDQNGTAIFNGWWPQTMNSLFTPHYFGDVTMKLEYPAAVDDFNNISPDQYVLMQNYPNPFNPSTVIRYQIPQNEFVSLEIFNILGQKVNTLVNDMQTAGQHSIHWNARNSEGSTVSSGVYIYKLKAGKYVEVKKMMLVR